MKPILLITLIFVFGTVIYAEPTLQISENNYYFSYPKQANWFQAQRNCHLMGMELLEIHDETFNTQIQSFLKSNFSDIPANQNRWHIGGTDVAREGSYYWVNSGKAFNYDDFNTATKEPNGGTVENCLSVWAEHEFRWIDISCNTSYLYYICKPKIISCDSQLV